jgi:hypothetical protein
VDQSGGEDYSSERKTKTNKLFLISILLYTGSKEIARMRS